MSAMCCLEYDVFLRNELPQRFLPELHARVCRAASGPKSNIDNIQYSFVQTFQSYNIRLSREPTSVSSLLDKYTIRLCIAGTHLCNIRVQNKRWSLWIFVVTHGDR